MSKLTKKSDKPSNGLIKYTLEAIQRVYGDKRIVTDDRDTAVSRLKKRVPISFSRKLIKETFDWLVGSQQIVVEIGKKRFGGTNGSPKNVVEGSTTYTTPDGRERSFTSRPLTQISGRVKKTAYGGYVLIPMNKKYRDLEITLISNSDAANHVDKVVGARLFQNTLSSYDATIEKTLEGPEYSSELVSRVMAIVYDHEVEMVPNEIDLQEILRELRKIPQVVTENDTNDMWSIENMKKRFPNFMDARNLPFVTIDPKTCKDMDDAICVEKHPDGSYTEYVAISLVSVYIEKMSAIFKDALKRGNSTYFADMVAPMLMKELSNIIGSLNPNEDRLAMITKLEYDKNGNLLNTTIAPGVMKSLYKLAYENGDDIVKGDVEERGKYSQEVLNSIDALRELEDIIRPRRKAKGATKFLTREFTYRLNATRTDVESLFADNYTKAHEMVETAMLSANKAFAEFAQEHGIPIINRVENTIEEQKIADISAFLAGMNIPFELGETVTSYGELQIAINKAVDFAQQKNGDLFAQIVSEHIIRCLPKARYDTENVGHFALNFDAYAHTTSPIRRLADFVNQKQILAYFAKEPLPFTEEDLQEICKHINYTERNSADLERETDDLLNAWFVNKRLQKGENLAGIGYISQVDRDRITIATSYGNAVVELSENRSGSPFKLSPDLLSITNNVTKKTYRVGQPLNIRPTKVDLDSRTINAEIIFEKGSAENNTQYANDLNNFYGKGM